MRKNVVNAKNSMSVRQSCPFRKGGVLIDTTSKIADNVNDKAAFPIIFVDTIKNYLNLDLLESKLIYKLQAAININKTILLLCR